MYSCPRATSSDWVVVVALVRYSTCSLNLIAPCFFPILMIVSFLISCKRFNSIFCFSQQTQIPNKKLKISGDDEFSNAIQIRYVHWVGVCSCTRHEYSFGCPYIMMQCLSIHQVLRDTPVALAFFNTVLVILRLSMFLLSHVIMCVTLYPPPSTCVCILLHLFFWLSLTAL